MIIQINERHSNILINLANEKNMTIEEYISWMIDEIRFMDSN